MCDMGPAVSEPRVESERQRNVQIIPKDTEYRRGAVIVSQDRKRRLCGGGVSWTWKDLSKQRGMEKRRGHSWAGFCPTSV